MRRVFDGPIGAEYRSAVAEKMGIEILATHYLGTRQVNLRQKRAVKTPADLAGVKMRMPGRPGMAAARPHPRRQPGAARHAGDLSGAQDRHGGRPGKSALHPQRREVLRGDRTGRAHRAHGAAGVLQHRQAGLGQAQRRAEDRPREAALKSAKSGSDNRLADEAGITTALKQRGLAVDAIDLAPFRAAADQIYAGSEMVKSWDKALLDRVAAA